MSVADVDSHGKIAHILAFKSGQDECPERGIIAYEFWRREFETGRRDGEVILCKDGTPVGRYTSAWRSQ